jgi:hypothetical protein
MTMKPVKGKWSMQDGSAAGCNNHGSYGKNPRYLLTLTEKTHLFVKLELSQSSCGGQTPSVNVSIYKVGQHVDD